MSIPETACPGTPTLDPQNPWPGLQAFTERDQAFFFGRQDELDEIARLVRREILTVLFGRSGLGKTSLLQAGLFPLLREEQFLPISLRLDFSPGAGPLVAQVKALVHEALLAETVEAPEPSEAETLWEFFHRAQIWNEKNRLLTPLLVFDQFEEIFTLGRGDERVKPFLVEISDLIENRIPASVRARLDQSDEDLPFSYDRQTFRVILSLREDFLPHLDDLRTLIPSLTKSHFRLNRMNGVQGLEAILKPGAAIVGQTVALEILRFIAGGREERLTATPVDLKDMVVEPALLSLFCRELNGKRLAKGLPEITTELVEGERGTILSGFYERSLSHLPKPVRSFIEDRLLTTSGFRRGEALEDALVVSGVTQEALTALVNRRLLRIERRLGTYQVELIHDVLTGVILESREKRRRKEHRRKLRRRFLSAAALLCIVALISLFLFLHEIRLKRQAQADRESAEVVINFMLFNLRDELSKIGRIDLLGKTQERALEYFESLPEKDQSSDSERNRGVAFNNLGDVYMQQGKTKDALVLYKKALPIFEKLTHLEPGNTLWKRDLGITHSDLTSAFYVQGRHPEALSHLRTSAQIADELARSAPLDTTFQQDLQSRTAQLGTMLLDLGESREGLALLGKATDVARQLTHKQPAKPELLNSLAECQLRQGEAQRSFGRVGDAIENSREALAFYSRSAEGRPRDLYLQQQLATTFLNLGASYFAHGDVSKSAEAFKKALGYQQRLYDRSEGSGPMLLGFIQILNSLSEAQFFAGNFDQETTELTLKGGENLIAQDPNNLDWRLAHAVSHTLAGEIQDAKGDPAGAASHYREALRVVGELKKKSAVLINFTNWLSWSHFLMGNAYAHQGNREQAQAEWSKALAVIEPVGKKVEDADVLDNYVRVLIALGSLEEARPICAKLQEREWNWRNLQGLCRSKGLLSAHRQESGQL
jgi:tetratricopeptide (TPR) repeat protein